MSWLMHHGCKKIPHDSPSLDDYKRPLPLPPPNFYWEKQDDLSWELKEFEKNDEFTTTTKSDICIEHVVLPDDTLQGICLRYGVNVVTLRQANMFSGNAFKSKKALRIPIDKGVSIRLQANDNDLILQRFKNLTNEYELESKFYLDENEYNLEKAYQAWVDDQKWASEHVDEEGNFDNSDIIEDEEIIAADVSYEDPTRKIVTPFEISYEEPNEDVFINITDKTALLAKHS